MTEIEKRRGSALAVDVGYVPARVPPRPAEVTPAQKAAAAWNLACDLDGQVQLVRDDVAALQITAAAQGLADWTHAQAEVTQGLRYLREPVEKASAALSDATEPETRARLAATAEDRAGVDSLVASCSAAPSTGTPVVRCWPTVLAALPTCPLPWGDEHGDLRVVVQIGRGQAAHADLAALRTILSLHVCSRRVQRWRGLVRGKIMDSVQRRTAACDLKGAERVGPEDQSNLLRRSGRCGRARAPMSFAVHARPCNRRSRRGKASASERTL